jgi:hypothetical protein
MTILTCSRCLGAGWVCEDNMDRPSDVITEGGCDCGGAAAPCRCNPSAAFEGWVKLFASTDPQTVKTGLH